MHRFKFILPLLFSCFLVKAQQGAALLVKEKQNLVTASQEYSASVYLINGKFDEVEFYYYGNLLPKDSSGAGLLKFKCAGGAYDQSGKAKKKYTITVKYKENGKPQEFAQDFSYTVKRPEFSFDSPIRGILYKNCGNEIFVKPLDPMDVYNPSCSVSGANIMKGSQAGQFTIIPAAGKVKLTMSNEGTLLGSKDFISLSPPAPTILVLKDSIAIAADQTISGTGNLLITIIPEALFAQLYPRDARYQLAGWDLTVIRNNKMVFTKSFQETHVDLASLGVIWQSGDYIIITIQGIKRLNFLNQMSDDQLVHKTFTTRIL